jgi:ferredoxin, 2Fe-2S
MAKVTFRQPDGVESIVEVPVGWSVMEAAMQNDVSGILAECGGGCACATCHVYVEDLDSSDLDDISDMEADMLECVSTERRPESRLSCQLRISDESKDLVVLIPDTQI